MYMYIIICVYSIQNTCTCIQIHIDMHTHTHYHCMHIHVFLCRNLYLSASMRCAACRTVHLARGMLTDHESTTSNRPGWNSESCLPRTESLRGTWECIPTNLVNMAKKLSSTSSYNGAQARSCTSQRTNISRCTMVSNTCSA